MIDWGAMNAALERCGEVGFAAAAREAGVDAEALRHQARRRGIKAPNVVARKYSAEVLDRAVADSMELGIAEAARRHGLPDNVLGHHVRRRGVVPARKRKSGRKDVEFDLVLAVLCVLYQGQELTLAEIGEVLGISRERVRQIEAQALRKVCFALMRRGISLSDGWRAAC